MLAYNENGNLQEFEENSSIVLCSKCRMKYRQRTVEQVPGFREIDEDICPFCGYVNGRSSDVEFYNSKLL